MHAVAVAPIVSGCKAACRRFRLEEPDLRVAPVHVRAREDRLRRPRCRIEGFPATAPRRPRRRAAPRSTRGYGPTAARCAVVRCSLPGSGRSWPGRRSRRSGSPRPRPACGGWRASSRHSCGTPSWGRCSGEAGWLARSQARRSGPSLSARRWLWSVQRGRR